jgi:polyisoprenoid-binding protein YceI
MRPILLLLALSLAAGCGDTSAIDDAPKASVQAPVEAAPAATPAPTSEEEGAAEPSSAPLALDPAASSIGFLGAKLTATHEGGFKAFKGALRLVDGAPASLTVEVDTASVFADKPKLESHLKSADFFDVASLPTATFTSTSFVRGDGDTYNVQGAMTMHGVTRDIGFQATVTTTDGAIRAATTFQINRQDFGITYPGKPDDLIKDEVALRIVLVFPQP